MTRTARFRVVCAAILVATSAASPAVAQPESTRLAVRLYDYANVPGDVLCTARLETERIYRGIGINTTWVGPKEADPWPRTVTVIIVDVPTKSSQRPAARALGQAARTRTQHGSVAYVFYERITHVTWRQQRDVGRILGLVIGHEIGHLLLPDNGHSDNGLMQASLGVDPFGLPPETRTFSAAQGGSIRQELASPAHSEALMAPAGGGDFTTAVGGDQLMAPAGASSLNR